MSIITKLVALGLAASMHCEAITFSSILRCSLTISNAINQLWLVTFINETGEEIVVQAKIADGSYAPLIPCDWTR